MSDQAWRLPHCAISRLYSENNAGVDEKNTLALFPELDLQTVISNPLRIGQPPHVFGGHVVKRAVVQMPQHRTTGTVESCMSLYQHKS